MWQRFSENARKCVFYAQEEAQHFGDGYVSTEHILLGLTRNQYSTAALVVTRLGHTLDELRERVVEQLTHAEARQSQDMTLTPRAKHVIDCSYEEARELGHNYIGTEHLLVGLIRERDGLAGRILSKAGLSLESVRQAIIEIQNVNPSAVEERKQKFAKQSVATIRDSQYRATMSRVREWANWAANLEDPDASLSHELDLLQIKLNSTVSKMEQSLLIGLCLEIVEGGSLDQSENWRKLQLSKEQLMALAEIGTEAKRILETQ